MNPLVQRYAQGETINNLASEHGMSYGQMWRYLLCHGATLRPRGRPRGAWHSFKTTPENRVIIAKEVADAKRTLASIGKDFGISGERVRQIAEQNGVPSRGLALFEKRRQEKAEHLRIKKERLARKAEENARLRDTIWKAVVIAVEQRRPIEEIRELLHPIHKERAIASLLARGRRLGYAIPYRWYAIGKRQRTTTPKPPDPAKIKARRKLNTEVRAGRIIRQPCGVCGSPHAHGHHADYSKPLEVTWLCEAHHRMLHQKKAAETHEDFANRLYESDRSSFS